MARPTSRGSSRSQWPSRRATTWMSSRIAAASSPSSRTTSSSDTTSPWEAPARRGRGGSRARDCRPHGGPWARQWRSMQQEATSAGTRWRRGTAAEAGTRGRRPEAGFVPGRGGRRRRPRRRAEAGWASDSALRRAQRKVMKTDRRPRGPWSQRRQGTRMQQERRLWTGTLSRAEAPRRRPACASEGPRRALREDGAGVGGGGGRHARRPTRAGGPDVAERAVVDMSRDMRSARRGRPLEGP